MSSINNDPLPIVLWAEAIQGRPSEVAEQPAQKAKATIEELAAEEADKQSVMLEALTTTTVEELAAVKAAPKSTLWGRAKAYLF
ncbi:MAG: hypothetical protein WAM28_01420 [Chlamydiales bacterium]